MVLYPDIRQALTPPWSYALDYRRQAIEEATSRSTAGLLAITSGKQDASIRAAMFSQFNGESSLSLECKLIGRRQWDPGLTIEYSADCYAARITQANGINLDNYRAVFDSVPFLTKYTK